METFKKDNKKSLPTRQVCRIHEKLCYSEQGLCKIIFASGSKTQIKQVTSQIKLRKPWTMMLKPLLPIIFETKLKKKISKSRFLKNKSIWNIYLKTLKFKKWSLNICLSVENCSGLSISVYTKEFIIPKHIQIKKKSKYWL